MADCVYAHVQASGFAKVVILGVEIQFCLFGGLLLLLGFCCSLWFLGECGSYVLLPKEFLRDPARCAHQGFWVKCDFRYWKLALRDEDGLGEGRGPHDEGKQDVPSGYAYSPESGAESEESATELEMGLGTGYEEEEGDPRPEP